MPHVSRLNLPPNPKSSGKWGRWPARSHPVEEAEEIEAPVVVEPEPVVVAPDPVVVEPGTPETVPVPSEEEGLEATGLPVGGEGNFVEPERVAGF